jgi:hypothetical protein
MGIRIRTSTRVLVAVPVALVAIVAGALAATAATPSRQGLMAALQRPAAQVAPQSTIAAYTTTASAGRYRLQLRIGPNRATVANALSIRVTEAGRPVSGARVTVAFSMPAMNMWQGFTSRPAAAGAGVYRATVPIIGMSGRWRLRVSVERASAAPVSVSFSDRMGA